MTRRQTFGQYLQSVDLALFDLTDGEIESADDLIDFADGEASRSDCYADGVTAKDCARRILDANGWDTHDLWPPEDYLVGYDCDGRPIGG